MKFECLEFPVVALNGAGHMTALDEDRFGSAAIGSDAWRIQKDME